MSEKIIAVGCEEFLFKKIISSIRKIHVVHVVRNRVFIEHADYGWNEEENGWINKKKRKLLVQEDYRKRDVYGRLPFDEGIEIIKRNLRGNTSR